MKKPVYELIQDMPYTELLEWMVYFEERPIDWRDDERTYKLLQAQGVKEKPGALFKSLNAIYNKSSVNKEDGTIDESFKNSFMYQKLITAISGDKIS